MDFLAAHPPLPPMAKYGGIWIPDGEDYTGLNDRWAVMQRRYARMYLQDRWETLLDCTARDWLQKEFDDGSQLNTERLLLVHLHAFNIWPRHLHRFLGTAALRCTMAQQKAGQCETGGEPGWRQVTEFNDARNIAVRIHSGGFMWDFLERRRPLWPNNTCSSLGNMANCCDSLLKSTVPHWRCFPNQVLSFSRCCGGTAQLLSLKAAAPSSHFVHTRRCWRLATANGLSVFTSLSSQDMSESLRAASRWADNAGFSGNVLPTRALE
ncbi:unnamed protein product [Polarella glacialis]|uniref:Uncharacterized protein n=1 Tax=Polarella glacialis TaxID=89957 RepID=A0A813KY81_POLGL|nr:unnamed protein product [Polarella glacialis]